MRMVYITYTLIYLVILVPGYFTKIEASSSNWEKIDNVDKSTTLQITKKHSHKRATREVEELFGENDVNAMEFIFDENRELMQDERYIMIEGDINLGRRLPHNSLRDTSKLWRDGIVYYVIDENFKSEPKDRILAAISEFEKNTCIKFKKRSDENDYVKITTEKGCTSAVGRKGGMQIMTLGGICTTKLGSILHEFMHAVGFFHEQSRTDRDEYVQINKENIFPGMGDNFKSFGHKLIDPLGAPYDYSSLLHYPEDAFSTRPGLLKTIEKTKESDVVLGQSNFFSDIDLFKINKLYNCGENGMVSEGNGKKGTEVAIDIQECFNEKTGTDYRGTVAISMTGKVCMNWAEKGWTDETSGVGNHNYCRNPDKGTGVWCYVSSTTYDGEYCDIGKAGENCPKDDTEATLPTQSSGIDECYVDPQGIDYRGSVSYTKEGIACQAWSDQYPNEHDYYKFIDGDHNHCRNPDDDPNGPWCYQTSGEQYGYCDVGQPSEHCLADPETCSYEVNMYRPGSNIYSTPDQADTKEECCSLCWNTPECVSWTFEKTGSGYGSCWLKDTVPPAVESDCCDSGIQTESSGCSVRENIDRPGFDINDGRLNKVGSSLACCTSCWYDPQCVAWTFDKRAGDTFGNCWLKDFISDPVEAPCCDSGILGY